MSLSPPFPIQFPGVQFGSKPLQDLIDDFVSEGIVGINDFNVAQRLSGANLSVDVWGPGRAYVKVDGVSVPGGKRQIYIDANSNSGTPGFPDPDWITTFTSPDASNPRIDRVVLTVRDSNYDGGSGSYDAKFKVIAGTPTPGATLTNLSGAAAVPTNCILLANVLVAAGATSITNAQIDSTVRTFATLGAGLGKAGITAIQDKVLTAPSSLFAMGGIPATFAHLLVIVEGRSDALTTNTPLLLRAMNDSGSNYDWQKIKALATTVSAAEGQATTSDEVGTIPGASAAANLFGSQYILIRDYTGTAAQKAIQSQSSCKFGTGLSNHEVALYSGAWRSTAAINQIALFCSSGNLVAGSRISLYGLGSMI